MKFIHFNVTFLQMCNLVSLFCDKKVPDLKQNSANFTILLKTLDCVNGKKKCEYFGKVLKKILF